MLASRRKRRGLAGLNANTSITTRLVTSSSHHVAVGEAVIPAPSGNSQRRMSFTVEMSFNFLV